MSMWVVNYVIPKVTIKQLRAQGKTHSPAEDLNVTFYPADYTVDQVEQEFKQDFPGCYMVGEIKPYELPTYIKN